MTHYRDGFWRTSVLGNLHWVEGHSVDRSDWSRGSPGGLGRSEPTGILGRWDTYEAGRFESYTIPNARCPVCRDIVFFYQSEHGGRVFFDPPLGPPWNKHLCTDSRSSTGSKSSQTNPHPEREAASFKPLPLRLPDGQRSDTESKAIAVSKETGWHPLLDIRVISLGIWRHVEGFDPIDKHRCSLITKVALTATNPTYIRVIGPRRITCEIEQAGFDESDEFRLIRGRSWFGVESLEEARIAKLAQSGDPEAMRAYGRSRSYRYLGGDNTISDVSEFVDLGAASYWLKRASALEVIEARFEYAYLQDLIAQHRVGARRRARHGPERSAVSQSSELPKASYVQRVGREARARMDIKNAMQRARASWGSNRMDAYYLKEQEQINRRLLAMAEKPHMPHLAAAIREYVSDATLSTPAS